MPIADIKILAGRTREAKQALIRAVTDAIAGALDAKPETIRVILHEIPREHWGIGGTSVEDLGR